MKQLSLNLSLEQDYNQDDYIISSCNYEAHKAIYNPQLWVNRRILILGKHGSGKTHLCNIFAKNQDNSTFIDLEKTPPELFFNLTNAMIIENIEKITCETTLFHLINQAYEQEKFLLMTASTYPSFALRDLQSRINATQKFLIKTPDDELLQAILLKHFTDKQLKVSREVLNYLFARSIRDFHFIQELVKAIDLTSLQEKRNVTLPLVKEVLKQKNLREAFDLYELEE
jgi:chromosomal replication initiation ATPase DnaA